MDAPESDDGFSNITLIPIEEPPPRRPATGRFLGQLLGGKYRMVGLLGRGAMGEVYKARVEGTEQRCAVKVMLPHVMAVAEHLARFRREARATSQIAHPNVIRVLELSEDGSRHIFFIVMELLAGRSTEQWLDSLTEPPPLADVRTVMLGIIGALEAAHEHGVVHRDLKPANVFLAEEEGKIVVKVLDFGLARITTERGGTLTKTDMVAGTPDYMSPEQCQSLKVGPGTDVYALGCILTELLQLDTVFGGNDQMEIMARQMFFPPPPLRRPADAEPVPEALEQLRLDLLAKKPEERPQRIADIRERFLGALRGSPGLVPGRLAPLPRTAALSAPPPPPPGGAIVRSPLLSSASPGEEVPLSGGQVPVEVALCRLPGASEDGVTLSCIAALGSRGIRARAFPDAGAVAGAGLPAIILDAGSDLGGAMAFLEEARRLSLASHTTVCISMLPSADLNRLVGAGVSELVLYPVSPEVLAERVGRPWRYGR